MAHHMPAQDHSHQTYSAADEKLFSKVGWRLLPLLIVSYVIAYIDRINIGYAQLQMEQTLSFSDAVYAFGAGVFFVGYFIFEVPSNMLLEKMGARKTLLRILFLWGLAAAGMAFVQTPMQFYVLRFLLGAFEAGFFPGVILYLTYWYPSARRAKAIAIFMTGAALGKLLAGPVSGAIMQYMDGFHGLHGWQWLFIMEGLPACVMGVLAFLTLKDQPEQASWLTPAEKQSLRNHLDNDAHVTETASHGSMWSLLRDSKVLALAVAYCLQLSVVYTVLFWTPTLVRSWGVQNLFLLGYLDCHTRGLRLDRHGAGRSQFRQASGAALALFRLCDGCRRGYRHHDRRPWQSDHQFGRPVGVSNRHVVGHAAVVHGSQRIPAQEDGRRWHRAGQQPGQPRARVHAVGQELAEHDDRIADGRAVPDDGAVAGRRRDAAAGDSTGGGWQR